MISNLNLKIKGFGPINMTQMSIGKINVIGGLNATGKSTTSRLLYCFLKGCTLNRKTFAYSLIYSEMLSVVTSSHARNITPDNRFMGSVDRLIEAYNNAKNEISKLDDSDFQKNYMLKKMETLDKQIKTIEDNDEKLYSSLLKQMLSSEFSSNNMTGFAELTGCYNEKPFDFSFEFKDGDANTSSKGILLLNDIFYFDSISIFDARYMRMMDQKKNERIVNLFNNINENITNEFLDDEINENIISVKNKIDGIINGNFEFRRGKLAFISENGHESTMGDTSSGIKQIGIIQLLLSNRKLKEDSVLIMDEPEVNLHPEWQIKFAEILVLLAKELDIIIYVNSHSPMFIEAMSLYSQYYDLVDETNFYLTEKQGNGFTFMEIDYDDMGAVYENLTSPYDELDKLKAKILIKE